MEEKFYERVSKYFKFLAMTFPVMCASDEFHFTPRAEDAVNYYHRMENLNADEIEETIVQLKDFQKEFSTFEDQAHDLEKLIDISMLKANIAGMLIELETNRLWCHNPMLYLKIAFIGLDHAITKPLRDPDEFSERFYGRLNTIPLLLHNAMNNITSVPETYYYSSIAMLYDVKKYLFEARDTVHNSAGKGMHGVCLDVFENVLHSVEIFQKYLKTVMIVPDHHFSLHSLEDSLREHFLSKRSLDEIYQIAVNEWHRITENLHVLTAQIDPGRSWQELYHAFNHLTDNDMDTLCLYRDEMEKLKLFFSKHIFSKDSADPSVEIKETPTYLRSVRGTASFGSALTTDIKEASYFYITTRLHEKTTTESNELLKQRLHKEYKFLTAHETIPGHHLIDSIRRRIKNPVRRQIESPLFYEGWASYAESLLSDSGYAEKPIDCVVEYKRRLWRAARCQIDAGIPAGKLTHEDAANLLTTVGFSREEAKRQLDRFRLNPGYQLCYTLGAYEICELKKKYSPFLGNDQFYHFFLNGGQLPFRLIDKRFEALTKQR